jgi:hypothetical protein
MSLSELIIGAHYNDLGGQSFDLDFVRDGGSATAGSQGAPAIVAGGKFNAAAELIGTDGLVYSGSGLVDAMVQTGTVSIWFKPNYSGSPSTLQTIFLSLESGTFNNLTAISHLSNGDLNVTVADNTGANIVDFGVAWSPTAGVWYHIELDFDVNVAGDDSRVFVDGSQLGDDTTTGTRSGTADKVYTGDNVVVSANADGTWDELLVYDAVQHTSNFTPPTLEINLDFLLSNPSFETANALTGNFPADWDIGGTVASWDWALFASLETLDGFEHSWDNDGRIAAFIATDITDALFDSALVLENVEDFEELWNGNEGRLTAFAVANLTDANFDSGTPENVEDFEEEWADNEDRIVTFVPATHLTDAEFDVANDDVEDFEEEWDGNEDRIVTFVPATHLADAVFSAKVGTPEFDDFETVIDLFVLASVGFATPTTIDPTHGIRASVSGTFVATITIQGRRLGSGTWEDQVTLTEADVPVEIEIVSGFEALRVETEAYTSGLPIALLTWHESP